MISWQIIDKNQLSKLNTIEELEKENDIKIKITKCFITKNDIDAFSGAVKTNYPLTPATIAVGQITKTLQESSYYNKGDLVYLAPMLEGDLPEDAIQKGIRPYENVGFLKEFTVIPKEYVHIIPKGISENDALFLNHISLALTVVDKLKIDKGEYVAIVGGSILSNIIAQLVSYYKAVPILIDNNEENLEIARKTDIYYTIHGDKVAEKEVDEITGGRKCRKVVYVNDSNISVDVIPKISANKAEIAITGIYSTKEKLNLSTAFTKQLSFMFIRSGFENVDTSINLLVQKAVNLKHFNVLDYKFDYAQKHFTSAVKRLENGETNVEFTINLL